ncbi:TetR/AcrR family transcriptional regulator [Mucilaginibacter boryungensis]|uniref:TetR/AcrR family transcriptional regulator n=1 Tax=Mucilaginibacter boryungensis TaxID=768480 RepID=A0ABR9XIG7_9SPHI|nr:TetR/AcrR family transcriptional regulator [Mucilaginibacter boryungensis]MBE9666879.1 TetR/AcrR family transcriptional regulator [Mucilaginibacter boryungensis]
MSQKERILAGSLELFFRAGIKSVTMDDIAKHLAVSKKTIYQFFTDKNELVIALVKQRMAEDEQQMLEIMQKYDNVIEQLLEMMKCSEEIAARANPILMYDLQKYHPEGWELVQQFKSNVVLQTLENLLKQGKEQGYIRPEIDVKVIARMRMNQVEMGFNTAIFPPHEFSPWAVQQQFLEHFNYGICTLEGYKLLEKYKNVNKQD